MKKTVSILIALVFALGGLSACRFGDENEIEYDVTKSHLNVGVFNAGLGRVWMDSLARDFEEAYKDVEFEEGKKGVQVVVDAKKNEFNTGNLSVSMENWENALYAVEFSDFDLYHSKGLLADITDVITEKVYDEDGNLAAETEKSAVLSIHDKMDAVWKREDGDDFYERNGVTYALPHRSSVGGIIYDADLFNSAGFYFFSNGKIGATQADIDAGRAGFGPDGKRGTADDGMPTTYKEFTDLLRTISNTDGIIPFTWAQEGALDYQKNLAWESFFANYEGAESYAKNFTSTDYEMLANQEGRKAGIQFFYDVVKGNYYSKKAEKQGFGDAQFEFIDSINTNNRIAMFMEGGYWESEAREFFNEAAEINPDMGYGKRDFRLLPIPNFVGVDGITDQTNTDGNEVLLGKTLTSLVFMAAKYKNKTDVTDRLAKLFLQFMHSRKQLSNFTRDTGASFKTFDFTPTAEELCGYTKFAQNVWRYISEGSEIVPSICGTQKWKDNYNLCETNLTFCAAGSYSNAASYFINKPSATVADCYQAVQQTIRSMA